MIKRLIYLGAGFTAIMLLSLCSNPKPALKTDQKIKKDSVNQTVTLYIDSGNIKTEFHDLFFYYHDSLYQSHGVGLNKQQTSFSLNAPAVLIDAVNNQTPYLVYPGENITISYPGTDSLQMHVEGDAKRNNELNFFRKLTKKTGGMWYFVPSMPYHKKVDNLAQIYDLGQAINQLKHARLQFLADYTRQFQVNDRFIQIAEKCINITAITDSLYLYRRNKELLIKQNLYEPFILAKAAAISRVGYISNQFYFRACTDLVDMMIGTAGDGTQFTRSFDFIDTNFTGLSRDYLLAKAVYSDFKNKVPITKNERSKFDAACKDKGYRDQIHNVLNENSKAFAYAKGSNKLLALDGKTVQDLAVVMAKYKGKLVLFDFWASWCAPCRREMPHTVILKKNYENKDVIFVTISTDGNIADWKKAAKEETMESDHNFLLLNADHASFIKNYKINAIPRYMLIGKDGKVINEDAPRPSDQKLKVLIDQYL